MRYLLKAVILSIILHASVIASSFFILKWVGGDKSFSKLPIGKIITVSVGVDPLCRKETTSLNLIAHNQYALEEKKSSKNNPKSLPTQSILGKKEKKISSPAMFESPTYQNEKEGSSLIDLIPFENNVYPQYPEGEKEQKTIKCHVKLTINGEGRVIDASIGSSLSECPISFQNEALLTLKKWRFKRTSSLRETLLVPVIFKTED